MEKLWKESVKHSVESIVDLPITDFHRSMSKIETELGFPPAFTISNFIMAEAAMVKAEVSRQSPDFPVDLINWYSRDNQFILMALIAEGDGLDYTKFYLNLGEAAKSLRNDPTGLVIINGWLKDIPTPHLQEKFQSYPSIGQELRDLGRNKYRKYLKAIFP